MSNPPPPSIPGGTPPPAQHSDSAGCSFRAQGSCRSCRSSGSRRSCGTCCSACRRCAHYSPSSRRSWRRHQAWRRIKDGCPRLRHYACGPRGSACWRGACRCRSYCSSDSSRSRHGDSTASAGHHRAEYRTRSLSGFFRLLYGQEVSRRYGCGSQYAAECPLLCGSCLCAYFRRLSIRYGHLGSPQHGVGWLGGDSKPAAAAPAADEETVDDVSSETSAEEPSDDGADAEE